MNRLRNGSLTIAAALLTIAAGAAPAQAATNLSLRFSDGDATYDLKYNAVW